MGHGLAWENGRKSAVLRFLLCVCKSARVSLSLSMCVGSARLKLSHVCATPTTFLSFYSFHSTFSLSLIFLFFSQLLHTHAGIQTERGKIRSGGGGADGTRNSSLVSFLFHRWRSHLRMGAPGNIKWVLLFGLNRNERRSKQQSRESFRVFQMGSSLFSSRQRLNENGKESQNGEGIGVERRREAAVGLWNAVSAPLSLSVCVREGFALTHIRPGPIQPRRLTAFLYTLLTNAVVWPQSVSTISVLLLLHSDSLDYPISLSADCVSWF